MLAILLCVTAISGCTSGTMVVSPTPTATPTANPTVAPVTTPPATTPTTTTPSIVATPTATPTPTAASTFVKGWGPYPTVGPWTPGDDTFVPTPTPEAGFVLPPWIDFQIHENMDRVDAPDVIKITGNVAYPQGFNLYTLRRMPLKTITASAPKKGGAILTLTATGPAINHLLDLASPNSGATKIKFKAGDGFSSTVNLADVRASGDSILGLMDDGSERDILVGSSFTASNWVSGVVEIQVI